MEVRQCVKRISVILPLAASEHGVTISLFVFGIPPQDVGIFSVVFENDSATAPSASQPSQQQNETDPDLHQHVRVTSPLVTSNACCPRFLLKFRRHRMRFRQSSRRSSKSRISCKFTSFSPSPYRWPATRPKVRTSFSLALLWRVPPVGRMSSRSTRTLLTSKSSTLALLGTSRHR